MKNPNGKNRALGRARVTLVALSSAAAVVGGCQAISGLSDLQVQDTTSTSGGGGGAGGAPATSTTSTSTTSSSTTSTGGSASTSSSSAGTGGEGGAACTVGSADACVEDNGMNGQCPPGHCSANTCQLACDDGGNEMYCGGGMGPGATTSTGAGMPPVTCGQPQAVRYACTFTCTATDANGCSGKTISCPNPIPADGAFPTCDVTCDGSGACEGTTISCGNGPCILHCKNMGCMNVQMDCGSGVCNVDSDMTGCPGVTPHEGDETCGPEVCVGP